MKPIENVRSFTNPRDLGFDKPRRVVYECPYYPKNGCFYECEIPTFFNCENPNCWRFGEIFYSVFKEYEYEDDLFDLTLADVRSIYREAIIRYEEEERATPAPDC